MPAPPASEDVVSYITGCSKEQLLHVPVVYNRVSVGFACKDEPFDRDSFGTLWGRPMPKRLPTLRANLGLLAEADILVAVGA